MSRNMFEHIVKCLHLVPKESIVHDRKDPYYDPIRQIRWLLEELVKNYCFAWNGSQILCVDECMVPYNGRFYAFKQYMKLKPVSHGIKIWCLACNVMNFVLNLEVYVGAANEAI